jgi:hypothetical protein
MKKEKILKMGRPVIDITGQRFGDLIAVEPLLHRDSSRRLHWLCYCDCGNDTFVKSYDLRNGRVKFCGHSEDLSGLKFNLLKAISIVGKDKHGYLVWRCECDCGNFSNVNSNKLKGKYVKSCGCLRRKANGLSRTKKYKEDYDMQNRYCLTLDGYQQLLINQDWCCKLCGINESDLLEISGKGLQIDHDHKTGQVRGLICISCNMIVGSYEKMKKLKLNIESYLGIKGKS